MIQVYKTGDALVQENAALLATNPYLSMFFALDARFLQTTNHSNYAIRAGKGEEVLLAMRVTPFSLLLFGSLEPMEELVDFLLENEYDADRLLGAETVCDAFAAISERKHGIAYEEVLAMDFMEAREKAEPSCESVEIPYDADLDEIVACEKNFMTDCGLCDPIVPERIRERLHSFRILRVGGVIASMASFEQATENAMKIANVYTRPEYRGQSLARKIVSTVQNEIIDRGMIATLNVDKKNPVSNHLYTSLGFQKVFSQGEYRSKA